MLEIFIILLLIVLNGIFAMAEIAVISSRKSVLHKLAKEGNDNAKVALELAKSPNRFLSTIQIGITVIGVFAGAFGGATIAHSFAKLLISAGLFMAYANVISFIIVISLIAFFSLMGELIPKRLALFAPEKIAIHVARPIHTFSRLSSILVNFISVLTELVLRILPFNVHEKPLISDEEVRLLLYEGTRTGVFELAEKDIVDRTLRLGDVSVRVLMTPRKRIKWLDINSSLSEVKKKIAKYPHAYFPICKGNVDKVIGIIHTESFLIESLKGKINVWKLFRKPLFIPESMDGLELLEMFKKTGIHMALVVSAYGVTKGLISLPDVLEAIVGEIPSFHTIKQAKK